MWDPGLWTPASPRRGLATREDVTVVTGGQADRSVPPAGGSVFVVDEDEGVERSFKLLLGVLQLEVESFHSAEELLARLPERTPDCLIAEVYLPGMSGIELLRELRARGLKIPAIVMATRADVPLVVEAMQLGALDFIEKPFVDRVLVSRVKQALAQR
jgi:two-component system, LuxR family, response regulator FixJ